MISFLAIYFKRTFYLWNNLGWKRGHQWHHCCRRKRKSQLEEHREYKKRIIDYPFEWLGNDIKNIELKMKKLEEVLKTNDCDLINESIDILNKSTESFAQRKIEKDFSKVLGKDVEEIT